jgi:hypothetical protein
VENPNRPGSFGTKNAEGKFEEKIRMEKDRNGNEHEHHNGGKQHLKPGTPHPEAGSGEGDSGGEGPSN